MRRFRAFTWVVQGEDLQTIARCLPRSSREIVEDDNVRMVDVIDAAYAPQSDDAAWLAGIVAAARPHLDDAAGVTSYLYRINAEHRIEMTTYFGLGAALPEPLVRSVVCAQSADYVRDTFATNPCAAALLTGTQETRQATRAGFEIMFAGSKLKDILVVNGLDPTGYGIYVGGLVAAEVRMTRRKHDTWSRVAAHLAAAYRNRRLGSAAPIPDDAEAIISPGGRVEHATEPAQPRASREILRDAAIAIDRARTRRANDLDTVEMWRALVAGRWTLVDRVDTDGRRLFIARKNDPQVAQHHALTTRERQVVGFAALGHSNKLVAYELGVAESTVAGHLASAASKLGVSSRAALIQIARALAPEHQG